MGSAWQKHSSNISNFGGCSVENIITKKVHGLLINQHNVIETHEKKGENFHSCCSGDVGVRNRTHAYRGSEDPIPRDQKLIKSLYVLGS